MIKNLKNIHEFVFDQERTIYTHPDSCTIDYQDGGEAYILESMKKVKDLSSHSQEFTQYIKDWPSRYHFSNMRINFLEAVKDVFPKNADVLEIGSGCGTITRWLGEQFHSVDALEGNSQRAVITRYRTKDLDNVKVYCGNILATGFDKKYDVITLIGSLEYIPLYDTEHDDPKEACTALLTRLKGALKENGILVIAIENKFGAKYFSGCKEDHTGREFEGIIGYPDKTPVTFSRNEIGDMLSQSRITHIQFYHVFPDYKLMETIIPEKPEVLLLYPYNWIQTPFENYSGNQLHLFPDFLFLKSITESGLFWHFSNSFVILASPTQTSNLTVPWFIKSYKKNENLNPVFYHEITLIGDFTNGVPKKDYLVKRSPLSHVHCTENEEKFKFQLKNEKYVPGDLLVFKFYTALFKKDPPKIFKQLTIELHNELLRNFSIGKTDLEGYPLVKGDAIDYTFWNIVIDSQNTFNFIDRKWIYKNSISADRILFRNLFNSYNKFGPFLKNKDKKSFILETIRTLYPQYSDIRLLADIEFEKNFQTYVSGRQLNFTIDSYLEQYSLSDLIYKKQELVAKVDFLNMSLDELKSHLEEGANRIEELERIVAAGTKLIEEMTDSIAIKENQLQDFTAKHIETEQKLVSKLIETEQKLSTIEKSIIWQFTMKFHNKIIERLLPQNTRRGRYYDLGLAGGKILINDGYHAVYQRYLQKDSDLNEYQRWIKKNESAPYELNQLKKISQNFSYRPKISILMPVWNTDEKWLRLAIDSVINQVYDNWELCIADGGSTKLYIKSILKKYAKKNSRIKVKFLTENKGISGNSNEALSLATGEFIGFLDHDDALAPFALHEVVYLLNQNQNFELIYSDEDKIDLSGNRRDPFFKPDWSPDYFLSQNYLCHFSVIRKNRIDSVGAFRTGYDGSQDYDLFLRCTEKISPSYIAHIPKILYHWRIIQGSAAEKEIAKPYAIISAKKALEDALRRRGQDGEVVEGLFPSSYRIRYAIQDNPLVSIIIPTKDHVDILKRCVQSILDKTEYKNYEIVIVDNQSKDPKTFEYYNLLETNSKIKILHYNKPFNYSAINNYAVTHVDSPYLLFLNNDTEVINAEWLSAMLEHAQRECVGAVGAKLLYPNNLIQHAGVIIGLGGVAGHSHKYFPGDDPGYCNRLRVIQNFSAVTAACVIMRKDIFQKIGGFRETLSIAFNDVDLCMRIRSAGYLIVYTPYSQLYHHESLSRGCEDTREKQMRFSREVMLIREQWGIVIDKGDPYYNPNLTLEREDFSIKN